MAAKCGKSVLHLEERRRHQKQAFELTWKVDQAFFD